MTDPNQLIQIDPNAGIRDINSVPGLEDAMQRAAADAPTQVRAVQTSAQESGTAVSEDSSEQARRAETQPKAVIDMGDAATKTVITQKPETLPIHEAAGYQEEIDRANQQNAA